MLCGRSTVNPLPIASGELPKTPRRLCISTPGNWMKFRYFMQCIFVLLKLVSFNIFLRKLFLLGVFVRVFRLNCISFERISHLQFVDNFSINSVICLFESYVKKMFVSSKNFRSRLSVVPACRVQRRPTIDPSIAWDHINSQEEEEG